MTRTHHLRFALLTITLLLAGCATPGAQLDEDAPLDDAPMDDTLGEGDGGSGERWFAFAFHEEVSAKSGGSGKIQAFSFTSVEEKDGASTILDVDVEVLGQSVEPIRASKMDYSTGSYEPVVVSNDLLVTKLQHTVTVRQDDAGEHQAGDVVVVTVYMPVEPVAQTSMFLWDFAKMEWTDAEGNVGGWEYYVTPEMEAETENGEVMYLPYSEEDATSWWGFEMITATYGLGLFSGWADGDQTFEEGSYSFGGFSYDVERETIDVGRYAFDGWHVRYAASSDGSSAEWMLKVSPDLPIPIAYRLGGEDSYGDGSSSSSLMSYELTDLTLG